MRILYLLYIVFWFFSSVKAQTSSKPPCNPGDPDGKPGCPSGDCPNNPTPSFSIPVLRASDPNEIIGRAGYDSLARWVSVKQNLEYKVLFENDPDFATAPAQNVTVYVPIHEKLNPSSLRISDFGFGSFNFSVPPNTSVYTNRLDVRDSLGVFVDVTAGLDVANRRAFWIFQSIDPATGLAATLPANTGFLPVNDSLKHNGEGYVTFTIIPSSRSITKDTISARASIIFDIEETIATNLWKNTIDAAAPSSYVKPLSTQKGSTTIDVAWEGQDDIGGSGIRDFDLYVSENNGPFSVYKTGLTGTLTTFTGTLGSSYRFYTLATDNVGNKEEPPATADAEIHFEVAPDLTPIVYMRPSTVRGTTDITMVVDIFEVNGVTTNGQITVKVNRDAKLSFDFSPVATSVANRTVQNSVWVFDKSDPHYYVLTTTQPIVAGGQLSFGLTGKLSPGATEGVLSESAVIIGTAIGEQEATNNADADKLEYFQQ